VAVASYSSGPGDRCGGRTHGARDQHGQVIDVLLSVRRDAAAARRFFTRAFQTLRVIPSEVVTDAAPVYIANCAPESMPTVSVTQTRTGATGSITEVGRPSTS